MNRMLPRVGLWALPLAGALIGAPWYLFGGFGGGGVRALDRDPAGFVRAITAPGAAAAGYAYVAGLVCLLFGLLALYALLAAGPAPAWAAAGPLLGVAATALLLPLLGVLVLADPVIGDVYRAGHPEVLPALRALAGGNLAPRLLGYVVLVLVLALLAAVASAVALWRAGLAPRWAGVLFALGFLLVIPSTPLVTPLGALLVLLGGGGMAWSLRGEATATRLEPA